MIPKLTDAEWMKGPVQVMAYMASDGSIHGSLAQAVAADIQRLPLASGSRGSSTITPAIAWAIIGHRKQLIELLTSLGDDPIESA